MRHTIIIGTGNEQLDELIKTDLEENGVGTVVAKVSTRNNIIKRFMETEASMLFIGEDLVGEAGTDEEWENIIDELRRVSLQIRIIYLCQRPAEDIFLTKLTTYSVHDIFNDGQLPPSYVEQLSKATAYKNIEKFRGNVTSVSQQFIEKSREQRAEEIISQGKKPKDPKEPKEKRVIEVRERMVAVPIYERL
jgi:hypothetical protein